MARARYILTVPPTPPPPTCDICGSPRVVWRKCKLLCENCGTVLMSCADLGEEESASES